MKHDHLLILVKHSQPEIVEALPAHEWILSESGRSRAELLADGLKPYQPDVLASSVEPKARQTAEILGERLNLKVQIAEGLHEHDRHGIPFYSYDEFQSFVREFFEKPDTLTFGNETADQALVRFRGAVEGVMKAHADKRIAIVSHGTVISLFVSWMTGFDGYSLWEALGLPSFVVLDVINKKLLETVNIN
jgi:2,3-bisphosphoglycerate-dependent phosphoglycerate mutase